MPEEENLKKLILKSQYVVEEYEETKEKMELYLQELYKDFPEEYKKMIASQNSAAKDENNETDADISGSEESIEEAPEVKEIEEETQEDEQKEVKKPESMRKLYRRISKMTHPDKVESVFLNDYFKKASTAYSENNISELITIASFLNIDTSDINKEDIISELKSDISNKQFHIAITKSSVAWRWAHAKTEKEKEKIKEIIKKYAKDNY